MCDTYPEGGDLARGYGSVRMPARMQTEDGRPLFNITPYTEELMQKFPLLTGTIEGIEEFKVLELSVNCSAQLSHAHQLP